MQGRCAWLLSCVVLLLSPCPGATAQEPVHGPAPTLSGCRAPTHHPGQRVTITGGDRAAIIDVQWSDGLRYGASFACDRRTGRTYDLGIDLGVPNIVTAFAGRYAAYQDYDEAGDGICAGLRIVDVATGRSWPMLESCSERYEDLPTFRRLAIHPSGAIAWAGTRRDGAPLGVFAILPRTRGADRPLQLRIGGPDGLRPQSLRTSRRGFCWTRGTVRRCVAAPRLHRCLRRGAEPLRQSTRLTVSVDRGRAVLCDRVSGRRWRLDDADATITGPVALRGPYAAITRTAYEGPVGFDDLLVVDGRTGRVRAHDTGNELAFERVTLKADGAVAYLHHPIGRAGGPGIRIFPAPELRAFDGDGRRVLDPLPDNPGDVPLQSGSGRTVLWSSGGERRSAAIRGAGPGQERLRRAP